MTKEINRIRRLMAEEDQEQVETLQPDLKQKFRNFEDAHQKFHDKLREETDIDASEAYFEEVENNYIDFTISLKSWLQEREEKKFKASAAVSTAAEGKTLHYSDFMTLANLPKVEIEPYDGDPMKYHKFMSIFDEHVHKTRLEHSVKLTRLIQYTTGRAREAIDACALLEGDGYEEARSILKQRFGDKFVISDHVIKSIKNGKPVKKSEDLRKFSDELLRCRATLKSMGRLNEIDTQSSLVDILGRLQPYLRNRWKREALKFKREKQVYPGFDEFTEFIALEAEDANDPVYGPVGGTVRNAESEPRPRSTVSFSSRTSDERKTPPCVACKGPYHRLFSCEEFRRMRPQERLQLVKNNRLCENCLLNNHTTAQCRKTSVCAVPGCGLKHTKFIHVRQESQPSNSDTRSGDQVVVAHANAKANSGVMLPVVEVNVNGNADVHALLDNGSNGSFCTERLVENLKIPGTISNYKLTTLSSSAEDKRSMVVDLCLTSIDGDAHVKLRNVYVVKQIPVHVPEVDLSSFPHLAGLAVPVCDSVDVLIGQDHAEALIPLDTRCGAKGDPFAVKTLLGWSLNGPVSPSGAVSKKVISHFVTTEPSDDISKLWNLEGDDVFSDRQAWSKEDAKVIEMWDQQVKLVDRHYELPVPWRPEASFPNNFVVAMSRLNSLRKNLEKRGLLQKYKGELSKLIQKGYAEPVPRDECTGHSETWYLPHQAVVTDKKPGKLRIVFDCASRFQGEALNDKAFQGPDVNNKLLDVLLRFRQHQFAFMADVEAMYNQVLIPLQDRDRLRFLWYNENNELLQYRMTRHLFGGVWCASSATYALRRVVVDNDDIDEKVAESICKSFYVDDCLQSATTEANAVRLATGNQSALSKGGFNLTKFVSNSEAVLNCVPFEDRAIEIKQLTPESRSKALGVLWNMKADVFYYDFDVKQSSTCLTKRSMLSTVASLYDPLGLAGPVLIAGRMVFQEATRLKLQWDSVAPLELQKKWESWLLSLAELSGFKIPRCIKPTLFDDGILELHHFSDASMSAYGCCSYIRCISGNGSVHAALITSKCKLAPLKSVTIPRLELQAAVLSAKADSYLRKELDLDFLNSYFWTDSQIVLSYLRNESRRFQVFVANRVSAITALTSADQWNHVSGESNPADLLTRNQQLQSMDKSMWLHGPPFLSMFKSDWPSQPESFVLSPSDPELKQREKEVFVATIRQHPIDVLAGYYSSWYRTKRAVAWWIRLVKVLSTRADSVSKGDLLVDEVKEAELRIIRHVQSVSYEDDLQRVTQELCFKKGSPLRDLKPILNADGLLCVGGRVKHAILNDNQKHPIIIPHQHPIAERIARQFHQNAHLGSEWTLSLIRSKYWITKARSIINRVRKDCVICKKLYGKPRLQQMADLPPERLAMGQPPFTFTGVDCFGPFMVKIGRSEVKRYGCLFTCLTVRAIHVEKLHSLDTDSFLNAYRRFEARRGTPSKVLCDNGTNFVGAQAELSRCLQQMDKSRIEAYGILRETQWNFNPPHAPHMGGVWERMIGVFKRVLAAVLQGSRLSDETLDTFFVEVESIVNGRPLTKLSESPDDRTPLTPHHLLLMHGVVIPPPGQFTPGDMYRRRWKYVQHLIGQFWGRWTREYMTELNRRSKWLDKQRNVKVGDLVLLTEEVTPRSLWPLGLVSEVRVGADGLVRTVTVKTRSTTLVRPITKIVMLEEC